MNRPTTCNYCRRDFVIDDTNYGIVEDGDYQVQYFACPHCGRKYQILTTDAGMRELIEKRKKVQSMISTARKKRFREETIRKYQRELTEIKNEQMRRRVELHKKGRDILLRLTSPQNGGEA